MSLDDFPPDTPLGQVLLLYILSSSSDSHLDNLLIQMICILLLPEYSLSLKALGNGQEVYLSPEGRGQGAGAPDSGAEGPGLPWCVWEPLPWVGTGPLLHVWSLLRLPSSAYQVV